MTATRSQLGGRLLDIATGLFALAAIWLAVQPGSLARVKLDASIANFRTKRAVVAHYTELRSVALGPTAVETPSPVIVFTDYNCDFCRAMEPSLDSLGGTGVQVVFIFVPRASAPAAAKAAEAVLCASEQGAEERLHRVLMRTEKWRTGGDLRVAALDADLDDIDSFDHCVESGRQKERLATMRALADSVGVTGTPTLVTSNAVHRGLASYSQIRTMAGQ